MFSHFSETRSMKSSRWFPSILSLEWTLSKIYYSDVWNQFSDKTLVYPHVAILWHLRYKWILSPLLIVLFEISRSYLWRRSSLHAEFAGFLKRTNDAVKTIRYMSAILTPDQTVLKIRLPSRTKAFGSHPFQSSFSQISWCTNLHLQEAPD